MAAVAADVPVRFGSAVPGPAPNVGQSGALAESGAMRAHTPVRPEWNCGGCGDPWPCADGRTELLTEYAAAPLALSLFLASCLVNAMQDLAAHRARHLHSRFLGWSEQGCRAGGGNRRPDIPSECGIPPREGRRW
nr:hypothetical protein [Micromonospora sp. DSM 115978]